MSNSGKVTIRVKICFAMHLISITLHSIAVGTNYWATRKSTLKFGGFHNVGLWYSCNDIRGCVSSFSPDNLLANEGKDVWLLTYMKSILTAGMALVSQCAIILAFFNLWMYMKKFNRKYLSHTTGFSFIAAVFDLVLISIWVAVISQEWTKDTPWGLHYSAGIIIIVAIMNICSGVLVSVEMPDNHKQDESGRFQTNPSTTQAFNISIIYDNPAFSPNNAFHNNNNEEEDRTMY
ncbi:unnamed protein product [Owenia fusiformis]|uniref:Uncharacterized protein n=1 Tax=Owenia fusiformis TaxID=6347 RepID=A0A8S4MWL1_OWEFU|nr:unnamed protein product [Owenia fusiformis]